MEGFNPKNCWTTVCSLTIGVGIGCSAKIDENEILGMYRANFAPGNTIEVLPKNLYIHKVRDNGGVEVNTNNWEFEYWDGRAILSFHSFSEGAAESNITNAIWPATIERSGRGLRLVYDRDSNQFFEKQNH